jgi:biotin carboxylase
MFYQPLKRANTAVAIVDGYSIGRYFATELLNLGYKCIHIQSTQIIPEMYTTTFQPQNYQCNLIYDGSNLQFIVDQLKENQVQCVISGTEPGVELTDILGEKLGVITNGTSKSAARRDKFQMIEALREHKLRTVKHCMSDNLDKILDFVDKLGNWPVVIKPVKSAGAENVFFCNAATDIADSFHKIIGTIDVFGNINSEVLAENYLDGDVYVVNMVSVNGQHVLSDFWSVGKKPLPCTNVIYYYQQLLPCSFHLKNQIVSYTREVLDALEIKYGATHNEICWTKEGPVLIESAARIMGAINPRMVAKCIGRSQLELTLASYLQPERFTQDDLYDYQIKKHLTVKFLTSYQTGVVKKVKFLNEIKSLPSFEDMSFNVEVGQFVTETNDLFTVPGVVYLCHEDEQVIQDDYKRIEHFEREMFEI